MAHGGMFIRQRAIDFMNHISYELVAQVIENPVNLWRVAPYDTKANMYGESDSKVYFKPVQLLGLINNNPEETETTEFGTDKNQNLIVSFNREQLRILNGINPNMGDVIEWNDSFFEIGAVDESKFPGGHTDYNFSIICYAHMTKKPAVSIDDFRVGESR